MVVICENIDFATVSLQFKTIICIITILTVLCNDLKMGGELGRGEGVIRYELRFNIF